MAAQMAALARSLVDHAAPTSDCAISHELMLWLLTQFASARSLLMVSAMTGEMVSSASSNANPVAFCAMPRANATSWSESMKEKAPANASMPPQPARNDGRLTVPMRSDCTGALRYRFPSVQCPEA